MSSLEGKTIVVTGATSGIGLATATELVRQGADVIGVGRSQSRCQAAEQRLGALNSAARVNFSIRSNEMGGWLVPGSFPTNAGPIAL